MNMNVRVCDKCGQHIDPQDPAELCEACTEALPLWSVPVARHTDESTVLHVRAYTKADAHRQARELLDDGDVPGWDCDACTDEVLEEAIQGELADDEPELRSAPAWAWARIEEALRLGACAFDKELRERIRQAIAEVKQLEEKDLEALAEQHFNIDHEPS